MEQVEDDSFFDLLAFAWQHFTSGGEKLSSQIVTISRIASNANRCNLIMRFGVRL